MALLGVPLMQADPRHLRYALPSWAFLLCEPILGIYSSCMQIHADTQVWVGGTEKTAFCSVRSDDGSADVRASNSSNNHNRQFSFLFLFFSGGVLGASAGTFRVCTVHQVLQVFVLAPSRTLNVIRARCSGSLYFQFLADKSRRQAGRQAG